MQYDPLVPAHFDEDLRMHVEDTIGLMIKWVEQGCTSISPFYALVPFIGEIKVHGWIGNNSKVFSPDQLNNIDQKIKLRMLKDPPPKYALIAYSEEKDGTPYLAVEAYGRFTWGFYKLTLPYFTFQGTFGFGEEAVLEHFGGHNPVLQTLNRSGIFRTP